MLKLVYNNISKNIFCGNKPERKRNLIKDTALGMAETKTKKKFKKHPSYKEARHRRRRVEKFFVAFMKIIESD